MRAGLAWQHPSRRCCMNQGLRVEGLSGAQLGNVGLDKSVYQCCVWLQPSPPAHPHACAQTVEHARCPTLTSPTCAEVVQSLRRHWCGCVDCVTRHLFQRLVSGCPILHPLSPALQLLRTLLVASPPSLDPSHIQVLRQHQRTSSCTLPAHSI